jgi:hypothetical protein
VGVREKTVIPVLCIAFTWWCKSPAHRWMRDAPTLLIPSDAFFCLCSYLVFALVWKENICRMKGRKKTSILAANESMSVRMAQRN